MMRVDNLVPTEDDSVVAFENCSKSFKFARRRPDSVALRWRV